MPARSKKQRRWAGMELERKREGKKTESGMSESELKKYASTPEKGLPMRKGKKGKRRPQGLSERHRF